MSLRSSQEAIAAEAATVLGFEVGTEWPGTPQGGTAVVVPARDEWLNFTEGSFCKPRVSWLLVVFVAAVDFVGAQEEIVRLCSLLGNIHTQAQVPPVVSVGPPLLMDSSTQILTIEARFAGQIISIEEV